MGLQLPRPSRIPRRCGSSAVQQRRGNMGLAVRGHDVALRLVLVVGFLIRLPASLRHHDSGAATRQNSCATGMIAMSMADDDLADLRWINALGCAAPPGEGRLSQEEKVVEHAGWFRVPLAVWIRPLELARHLTASGRARYRAETHPCRYRGDAPAAAATGDRRLAYLAGGVGSVAGSQCSSALPPTKRHVSNHVVVYDIDGSSAYLVSRTARTVT